MGSFQKRSKLDTVKCHKTYPALQHSEGSYLRSYLHHSSADVQGSAECIRTCSRWSQASYIACCNKPTLEGCVGRCFKTSVGYCHLIVIETRYRRICWNLRYNVVSTPVWLPYKSFNSFRTPISLLQPCV